MHDLDLNNKHAKKKLGSIAFRDKLKQCITIFLTKPEILFVVLSAISGLIMVFVMPPFRVPDEVSHFSRAYQVSQGGLIGETVNNQTGGYLPFNGEIDNCSSSTTIKNCPNLHQKINLNQTSFVRVSASAYSPLVYIPQVIGIDIGKITYPSIYVMSTLGRIFNLVAYIMMFYLAIRLAKLGKWVYVVIGLFPVAIQQAASLSGDVMTIGLCVVWIAIMGNLFLSDKKINKQQFIVLILLAIGLALTKQTDVILVASVLFLPKRIFVNIRQRAMVILTLLATSLLAVGLWYLILRHINFDYSYDLRSTAVSQTGQLSAILHHPGTFIVALLHEYIFEGFHSTGVSPDFLITSMHSFFSSFLYKFPLSLCILGYVGLLISFLYTDRHERADEKPNMNRLAITQTSIFLISIVAIAGALYLSWSPVGSSYIYGVQGRYFIPIVPLLIPIFVIVRRYVSISTKGKYTMGIITGSILFINLVFMVALTYRFFYV